MTSTPQTKPLIAAEPDFFSLQVVAARRFHLPTDQPPFHGISVICGGCETCRPDYRVDRRSFPYLSIEYVAGGEGALTLDGRNHRLLPGVLFAYGPGIPHRIDTDPANRLVKYFVDFAGPRAARLLGECPLGTDRIVQTSEPDELMRLFDDLIRSGLRSSPFAPRLCALRVEQLVLTIADTAIPTGTARTHAFATYQRCLRHIEANYLALHSLEDVSAACHVNTAYLCRLFRRYDRQTPYQALVRQKMNHAASRLREPGVLVTAIADELGYSDPYHFSRVFKRVFGVPPATFRDRS